ncbi:unnamed protein product, partial [Brassica oleracea]
MPGSSASSSGQAAASSSGQAAASSSGQVPGQNCECSQLQSIGLDDLQNIMKRRQKATKWIDVFESPLQKACICRQLDIVKLQLQEMTPNQTRDEILALDTAAGSGDLETVKNLCKANLGLLGQQRPDPYGLDIPVVRASNAGHKEVTRYLFDLTPLDVLMHGDGYWAICLLLDAILYGFLDIVLEFFQKVRSDQVRYLAATKHSLHRSSPLRFIALKPDLFRSHYDLGLWQRLVYTCIDLNFPTDSETPQPNLYQRFKQIYELKDRHLKADTLLRLMCKSAKEIRDPVNDKSWRETIYEAEALLEAVENGNKEFFIEIIKCNPKLLWISEAVSGRNLFQLAVIFRKEKIFNLIRGLDNGKVALLRSCDKDNNNILHIVAYLSPRPDHLSKISGSALKMQREIRWYMEVKSLVSEREVVQKNNEKMTPRQVFEVSHEPLRKEGEEWMKYTATACSFVAALIATVTFQAIFTVPGGYDETLGKPLLLRDLHFTAFIISDSLAFFTSCTSVLIFLSILTARYSFDDFIVSLPRKMIFGLAILFFSIASMLVGFITALSSTMRQKPTLVVPMKPLAALPVLLFLMFQYPLLKEMISSTYGKRLFHRDTKNAAGLKETFRRSPFKFANTKVPQVGLRDSSSPIKKAPEDEAPNDRLNIQTPFIESALSTSRLQKRNTNLYYDYIQLSQGISQGRVEVVKDFLNRRPDAVDEWINFYETPLLKACACGKPEIVKELLRRMTPEQMIPKMSQNASYHTPLTVVAVSGNMEIAEVLIAKNPKLLEIPGNNGQIPVVVAVENTQMEMARYLYIRTPVQVLLDEDGYHGSLLFLNAIFYKMLDIALDLFSLSERLAVTKHSQIESIPIIVLASKPDLFPGGCYLGPLERFIYSWLEVKLPTLPEATRSDKDQHNTLMRKLLKLLTKWTGIDEVYRMKVMHLQAEKLLLGISKETLKMGLRERSETVDEALLFAVRFGNVDFLVEMIKNNSELLWSTRTSSSSTLFLLAVEFRQEKVFSLLYGLDDRKHLLLADKDCYGNGVLHLAGYPSPPSKLSNVVGATLQMQRELQWFKVCSVSL